MTALYHHLRYRRRKRMSASRMSWRACRELAFIALAGCGRVAFDRVPDDAIVVPDAPLGDLSTFGPPELVPGLSMTGFDDDDPVLSSDQLELYFTSDRPSDLLLNDVWRSVRDSTTEPWSPPVLVEELSTDSYETQPALCCDDLVMYLGSTRPPSMGDDLFIATRPTRDAPWSVPVRIGELASPGYDGGAAIDRDGLAIIIDSDRTSGLRSLHRATRPTVDTPWSAPTLLAELASGSGVVAVDPSLAGDVALVFATIRGGPSGFDLWVAVRPAPDESFGAPTPITIANTSAEERDPWLSADGRTLYFARRSAAGDFDIMMATR